MLDISTPEELASALEGKTDAEVTAVVAEQGLDPVLDKVFTTMVARFLPDRTHGARAVIQWNLATSDGLRDFYLEVDGSKCSFSRGRASAPRVSIDASLPVFLRIVAGRLNGLQAFANGDVRVSGEQALALSQQIWFDVDMSQARLDISTPSQLRRLIAGRGDEEIEAGIAVTGTDTALRQIFEGMVDHYLPHKGPRKRTVVEFSVRTSEGDKIYQFVADKEASYHEGARESANVTLLLRITTFLRMVSGELDGILALAQGKVKVRGNILVARNVQSWFDMRA